VEQDSDSVAQKLEQHTENSSSQKEEVVAASSSGGTKQQVLVQSENEMGFSVQDLHGNDTKILSLLNEEEGSNYSFKGIMRKLHIHQQSLARALHRLEEMGLVERSHAGYRLSKIGETNVARTRSPLIAIPKGRAYMQLLQTYIPIDIRPAEIVRTLVGKWFRNLRWIGLIESETGFTLQWTSEDGSFQINLRMVADYIIIETNAASEKEKVQAMVGSYAIYEQITKILQERLTPANAYVFRQPEMQQRNN